jgi:hypothetical protein
MKHLLVAVLAVTTLGRPQLARADDAAPAAPTAPAAAPAGAMSPADILTMLKTVDDRQRNSGDYKSLFWMQQKEKDKQDVIYEGVYFRRSEDKKLMILFLEPKASQGQGYLRMESNLWFYDPTVGKWERRTERERIGGTNSRRSDFDDSRLADEYEAAFVAREKLGVHEVVHLKLTGKSGIDVAFPVIELWVDGDMNVLKRQEFALSGKLMRTAYYPKWEKVFSESKKTDVWYPKEIRFFDEVEKGNSTVMNIKQVDLKTLDANMFTKAWLESKSR